MIDCVNFSGKINIIY